MPRCLLPDRYQRESGRDADIVKTTPRKADIGARVTSENDFEPLRWVFPEQGDGIGA
jgi:hypothetical protein